MSTLTVWLVVLTLTYDVYAATDLKLTAYGPHTEDMSIILCPNDDYVLVFHCAVTSRSFVWILEPFLPLGGFSFTDDLGERISEQSVTVILTKKEINGTQITLGSQLQVLTGDLREIIEHDGSPLQVICRDAATRRKTISIMASVRETPAICADIDEQNGALIVRWSSNITKFVNIVVMTSSIETGLASNISQENMGTMSFAIDPWPTTTFIVNVTVMIFDNCGEILSAETIVTHATSSALFSSSLPPNILPSSPPSQLASEKVIPTSTTQKLMKTPSITDMQTTGCSQNDKTDGDVVIVLSILLGISVIIIFCMLVLVLIAVLRKKKHLPNKIVSASNPETIEGKKHEDTGL